MIDPLERWREFGEKPDYAGLLTFGGLPYTQDAAELEGVDVAIVGAPTDDLVSDRPGSRFAPRAIRAASCPPGPHLEAKVDATRVLRIVDFGDAPVIPADPVRTHEAIERTVAQVVTAGAVPIVLGGDHSIAEPDIRACAAPHGMLGLAYAHGLMWARTGELRETAVAFLGIEDWRFLGPIFVGDTIFVDYVLAELRDSRSRPSQAIAIFEVAVVNQDGATVQRGRKALLVSKVPLEALAASAAPPTLTPA